MATASVTGRFGVNKTSSAAATKEIGTFLSSTPTAGIKISQIALSNGSNSYLSSNAHNYNTTLTYKITGSTQGEIVLYSAIPPASGTITKLIGTTKTLDSSVVFKGAVKLILVASGNSSTYSGIAGDDDTATITYSNANTTPATPTISYPAAADAITYNTKPYFKMKGTDADGNKLTYQYKIDSTGTWTNVATGLASGTDKEWQPSAAIATGSHTLYVRTYDGTAYSSEAKRGFKIATCNNASSTITQTQMANLKTYIDEMSKYYGTGSSTTITAPTKGNKINASDWTNYVTKINAMPHCSGVSAPSVNTKINAGYYNNNYTAKLRAG